MSIISKNSHYGPRTITNGLVLCLDAANSKSYPGSGTTWTDLSGNGNNGTLENGPTFNSDNGGSLVFDNIDDYFDGSFICNKTYYSIDFWCYPTELIDFNWAMKFNSGWNDFNIHSDVNGGVYVGTDVATRITPWRSGVYVLNTGQNFTWTFDNGLGKFYKNGVLETSKSMAISAITEFTTYESQGTGTGHCTGRLSNFKVYSNRALTAAEVAQNYNALKSRYI